MRALPSSFKPNIFNFLLQIDFIGPRDHRHPQKHAYAIADAYTGAGTGMQQVTPPASSLQGLG